MAQIQHLSQFSSFGKYAWMHHLRKFGEVSTSNNLDVGPAQT